MTFCFWFSSGISGHRLEKTGGFARVAMLTLSKWIIRTPARVRQRRGEDKTPGIASLNAGATLQAALRAAFCTFERRAGNVARGEGAKRATPGTGS